MEVIKCGLCKEEIKYSQRCRVYIKTDEQRNVQRSSKRPHIGRYKLISTANSTEHISFARRLKALKKKKNNSTNRAPSDSTKINNNCEEAESESLDCTDKTTPKNTDENKFTLKKKEVICDNKYSAPKVGQSKRSGTDKKSKSMSHPHFQSSFEEYIKPSLKTPAAKVTKTKSCDSNSDIEGTRKSTLNSSKIMKNGNATGNTTRSCVQEFETYYWLDLPKSKPTELRKLGYQFDNLVTEVKHMKLPSSEWKIKIMVHKQEMVSVSFSNKQTPEKVVSVNAKNSVCDISIDSKKLLLIGSPIYILSIKDLEMLLDIVNCIDPSSSLIQYL